MSWNVTLLARLMDEKGDPKQVLKNGLSASQVFGGELAHHEQLQVKTQRHLQPAKVQQLPDPIASVWITSTQTNEAIKFIQPSLKITRIEALVSSSNDIVGRLRASKLGVLYRNHFKHHTLIRWIVGWVWRKGFPIYVNYFVPYLVSNNKWRKYSLIKLSDFVNKQAIPTYKLTDPAVFEIPAANVFPTTDESYLASSNKRQIFHETFVAIIPNATICGGTNLILKDDLVVCHDMYDFLRDYTSEELHGRTMINPISMRIKWSIQDDSPELMTKAATFVDACASNYAHWLTEILPRIILFCTDQRFRDVPIVVNDCLHKNIMESLFLFVGTEREVIILPIGRALVISELYVTSVTGYVPFGRRDKTLLNHSHGSFNPRSFDLFREHIFSVGIGAEKGVWPDKIYLRRNSGTRLVVNSQEIEKLLLGKGFVIVEAEKLTFLEQIQLFSHANEIIAPTGAALANCLSCKPGTKVAVLMSKHKDMIYGYWNNLISPLGIKVYYILGKIVNNYDLGMHGDFTVDIGCVDKLLEVFEKK